MLGAVLFYVGWFACVMIRTPLALLLVAVILAVYVFSEEHKLRALTVLLVVLVFGFAIDNAMLAESVIIPQGSGLLAPAWMTALWPLFATTLNGVFKPLQTRLALAALLGGVLAPFSYLGAVKLGAAEFGVPAQYAMIGIGFVWAIVFPVALLFVHRLMARV